MLLKLLNASCDWTVGLPNLPGGWPWFGFPAYFHFWVALQWGLKRSKMTYPVHNLHAPTTPDIIC